MSTEEALEVLQEHLNHWNRLYTEHICEKEEGSETIKALNVAIKALEQEPVLDKIRAEIEQEYTKFRNKSDMWNERACGLGTALEIIDKYKAESEEV